MKVQTIVLFLAALVFVECGHTFMGTNYLRPLAYHTNAKYSSKLFQKRIEYLNVTLNSVPGFYGRSIQGILAYDLTNSSASANVTLGGIGYNYVNLRLKSDTGKKIDYDVYIYA